MSLDRVIECDLLREEAFRLHKLPFDQLRQRSKCILLIIPELAHPIYDCTDRRVTFHGKVNLLLSMTDQEFEDIRIEEITWPHRFLNGREDIMDVPRLVVKQPESTAHKRPDNTVLIYLRDSAA